jgi:hypothetical protein
MAGRHLRILVGAVLAMVAAWPADGANLLELNFWLSGPRYDGVVPLCDEPGPLAKIMSRFAEKESRYWNSALQIVGFKDVRQTAFRPWAANTIPRRFCRATALISDGRKSMVRPVYYWIGEDTGWLGAGWGVEWCVVGLDRNWAYNPGCRMAQP